MDDWSLKDVRFLQEGLDCLHESLVEGCKMIDPYIHEFILIQFYKKDWIASMNPLLKDVWWLIPRSMSLLRSISTSRGLGAPALGPDNSWAVEYIFTFLREAKPFFWWGGNGVTGFCY